ncbi:alpha/beta fold hydrolase [Virgibacillus kekensis]|uniref:Alpha/beta fold hydrolase n=1 Tax=Virgibacillus kekensis TaxID=202261 RepID=A0ABV9DKA2_9BACI
MGKWKRKMVNTLRGKFEVFVKGEGTPVCVTHHYSEFNETGDYFADMFCETNQVFLVNPREAGGSAGAAEPYQLSMLETVFDLEAVRKELGFPRWGIAGHSTGGMLGVIYGIYYSRSLTFNVIVGAAAREYMTFSEDCIYNEAHPDFERMQELNELLKRADLEDEERRQFKIERTKFSLTDPARYHDYFNKEINKGMSAIRMNFFSRELQVYDVTRKLGLSFAPTLIMCGRNDVQCPLTYSEEMSELIPNSRLVVFEHSNHYPFLEEEDLFRKAYVQFVCEIDK